MIRNIVRGFLKFFLFFSFRVKIVGAENVNTEKGVIVAPNHRSNWDAVILGAATKRELRFLAKSELFKNKLGGMFLKWLITVIKPFIILVIISILHYLYLYV